MQNEPMCAALEFLMAHGERSAKLPKRTWGIGVLLITEFSKIPHQTQLISQGLAHVAWPHKKPVFLEPPRQGMK
jgi:hypothetical protein